MKKLVAFAVIGSNALVAVAAADESNNFGIRFRLGYEFGASFDQKSGKSGNINGPTIGADFVFSKRGGMEFAFTPTIVMGGALGQSETDGRIYRFTMNGTRWFRDQYYLRLDAGFGHTQMSGFDDVDGFMVGAAVGFKLSHAPGLIRHYTPNLEFSAWASSQRELSGFGITLTLGF